MAKLQCSLLTVQINHSSFFTTPRMESIKGVVEFLVYTRTIFINVPGRFLGLNVTFIRAVSFTAICCLGYSDVVQPHEVLTPDIVRGSFPLFISRN